MLWLKILAPGTQQYFRLCIATKQWLRPVGAGAFFFYKKFVVLDKPSSVEMIKHFWMNRTSNEWILKEPLFHHSKITWLYVVACASECHCSKTRWSHSRIWSMYLQSELCKSLTVWLGAIFKITSNTKYQK